VALPISELESKILPARVSDYHPRMLDALGATGELVWLGAGALGAKDGRVVLARRDRARALAPEPRAFEPSALHVAIERHLEAAGASFLVAIEQAAVAPRADVIAALWELVWAGRVTNDTFAPLRSLAAPAVRRAAGHVAFGGRWSLVASLGPLPAPTVAAHARATALLDRWGVASRAAARADEVAGGFAGIVDVLRAMEDAGTIRRGYFVDGLEGAQFAWPAAIDRLREPARDRRVDVLSVLDPACAWGSALPWPELRDGAIRPARRTGASIIQVAGQLALWIEPRGRRIATAAVPEDDLGLAIAVGLPVLAARSPRRELLIETIDDVSAGSSPLCPILIAAGGRIGYHGIVL
jgi:ATP-dependent Lhr-like helicase